MVNHNNKTAVKKIADAIVKKFTQEKCDYARVLNTPSTDIHGFEELLPKGKWMEFGRAEKIFNLLQISSDTLVESLDRFGVFSDGLPKSKFIEKGYYKVRTIVQTVNGDFAVANPPVVLVSLEGLRFMHLMADLYLKESVYRSYDSVIPLVQEVMDFLDTKYEFVYNEKSGFIEGKAIGETRFISVTSSHLYWVANEMFRAGITCDRNLLEIILLSAYRDGADAKAFMFNNFHAPEPLCDRNYNPFLKQKG